MKQKSRENIFKKSTTKSTINPNNLSNCQHYYCHHHIIPTFSLIKHQTSNFNLSAYFGSAGFIAQKAVYHVTHDRIKLIILYLTLPHKNKFHLCLSHTVLSFLILKWVHGYLRNFALHTRYKTQKLNKKNLLNTKVQIVLLLLQ